MLSDSIGKRHFSVCGFSTTDNLMRRYIRFIPNMLSSCRLLLALMFPFIPEHTWTCLIIGGGTSDILDGWLARRWRIQTATGALLDAVADKAFVLSALLTVAVAEKIPLFLIPLLLARDLLVAGTAVYAVLTGVCDSFQRMNARWSGKLATAGQFILLLTAALYGKTINLVLWPAILFSVFAAGDYSRLFILELRRRAAI